jgi:hypothetical protein
VRGHFKSDAGAINKVAEAVLRGDERIEEDHEDANLTFRRFDIQDYVS